MCPHCGEAAKAVDHIAMHCKRMLAHDYTQRHNDLVQSLHLLLCSWYGLKSPRKIRLHSVQEVLSNRDVTSELTLASRPTSRWPTTARISSCSTSGATRRC
ncbi:hypothetical protein PAPHI01_1325 [Pancytospora philotis]|nr:hypothetical protein PAPHI01_1325 [Pancytospora philotis]